MTINDSRIFVGNLVIEKPIETEDDALVTDNIVNGTDAEENKMLFIAFETSEFGTRYVPLHEVANMFKYISATLVAKSEVLDNRFVISYEDNEKLPEVLPEIDYHTIEPAIMEQKHTTYVMGLERLFLTEGEKTIEELIKTQYDMFGYKHNLTGLF